MIVMAVVVSLVMFTVLGGSALLEWVVCLESSTPLKISFIQLLLCFAQFGQFLLQNRNYAYVGRRGVLAGGSFGENTVTK